MDNEWIKSSYSSAVGNCVELQFVNDEDEVAGTNDEE